MSTTVLSPTKTKTPMEISSTTRDNAAAVVARMSPKRQPPAAAAANDEPVQQFFISGAAAPRRCFVGERVTFKINACRTHNNATAAAKTELLLLKVFATRATAALDNNIIAHGKIIADSNCETASAQICFTHAGQFNVNTKFSASHIRGSPFVIKVFQHAPRFQIQSPAGGAALLHAQQRHSQYRERYNSVTTTITNTNSTSDGGSCCSSTLPKKSHTFHDGFIVTDALADEHNARHHNNNSPSRLRHHSPSSNSTTLRHGVMFFQQLYNNSTLNNTPGTKKSSDDNNNNQVIRLVSLANKREHQHHNHHQRSKSTTPGTWRRTTKSRAESTTENRGENSGHKTLDSVFTAPSSSATARARPPPRIIHQVRSTSRAQSENCAAQQQLLHCNNNITPTKTKRSSVGSSDDDSAKKNSSEPPICFGKYGRFLGCFLNPQDVCILPSRQATKSQKKFDDDDENIDKNFDYEDEDQTEEERNYASDSGLMSANSPISSSSNSNSSTLEISSSRASVFHSQQKTNSSLPRRRRKKSTHNNTSNSDLLVTDSNLPAIQRFTLNYHDNNPEETSSTSLITAKVQCKISERGRALPHQILRPTGTCYIPAPYNQFIIADYEKGALLVFDAESHDFVQQIRHTSLQQPQSQSRSGMRPAHTTLLGPKGIAYCQRTQSLYVCDNRANRVCVFQQQHSNSDEENTVKKWQPATSSTYFGNIDFAGPHFIAIDNCSSTSDSVVYVSDFHHHMVRALTADGRVKAQFTYNTCAPTGVAVDPDNNLLLVASWANGSVCAYDTRTTQLVRTVVGGGTDTAETAATTTQLFGPQGIEVDLAQRMLLVCDAGNHRVVGFPYLLQ